MKERLPGYFETRTEINYLLFRLSLDCRVLQKMIKNSSNVLKDCNRVGSITDGAMFVESFKSDIARVQQKVTQKTNTARRLFVDFVEKQRSRDPDNQD